MLTIHNTDALTALKEMESESIQCVVTSPPYWNLRDYGTGKWDGGEPDCDHLMPQGQRQDSGRGNHNGGQPGFHGGAESLLSNKPYRDTCAKCGAVRSDVQIGLERTPEEYITNLVEIFREVRRVLKGDGTLWLNLGDSYASGGTGGYSDKSTLVGFSNPQTKGRIMNANPINHRAPDGLKPKDLCMIPARVALALQGDGWWLRSEITWCKRAPMPESVTDRPTSATERIFLLTKSEKYLYNKDEVRMSPLDAEDDARRILYRTLEGQKSNPTELQNGLRPRKSKETPRNDGDRWNENNGRGFKRRSDKQRGHSRRHAGFNDRWDLMTKVEQMANGANLRNYWVLSPDPFPEAHFATFPKEIPLRCILLGSNAGDMVLDPFAGSGTTGKVAIEMGRKAILIEPNPEYVKMIERRCQTTIGLPL